MVRRFASIWFPYLTTDRYAIREPILRTVPFVLVATMNGRKVITEANGLAESHSITRGMVVADAKACLPGLEVADDRPGLSAKLLKVLGIWCIRYTPVVAVDMPDGLILDISGCAHLWGGEDPYRNDCLVKLQHIGFHVRMAISDTIGAAWAAARFGTVATIIPHGGEADALRSMPPAALRLEPTIVERLRKLGLRTIGSFMHMPSSALRRRFGEQLPLRLRQALGKEDEPVVSLRPIAPYEERLPCLEPVRTAAGIEVAICRLLESICERLSGEGKGLRKATLKCYRVDGKSVQVGITTSRATASVQHLMRLFALKVPHIEPALGIELFVLNVPMVDDANPVQEVLWGGVPGLEDTAIAELVDRLQGRIGIRKVYRFLPDEHHWPERSFKEAITIAEKPSTHWKADCPRPTRLLTKPEPIEVVAPIPDYPPLNFRHRGEAHVIKHADGPERIEREWWMDAGEHRDYYYVEDDKGRRYWLYRSGHYGNSERQWFLHGFFA